MKKLVHWNELRLLKLYVNFFYSPWIFFILRELLPKTSKFTFYAGAKNEFYTFWKFTCCGDSQRLTYREKKRDFPVVLTKMVRCRGPIHNLNLFKLRTLTRTWLVSFRDTFTTKLTKFTRFLTILVIFLTVFCQFKHLQLYFFY